MVINSKANFIIFFTWIVVALVLFALTGLVLIQQDMNMKRTLKIQQIQKKVSKIQNINKELLIEIDLHNNLENIERIAESKYGMVYPNKVEFIKESN